MNNSITTEAAIFDRSIAAAPMSVEVARHWLGMAFGEADRRRMAELAAAARAGGLTDADRAEIDVYQRAGSFLGCMQARARKRLRETGAA